MCHFIGQQMQGYFWLLEKLLNNLPVLAIPNFDKKFALETDASISVLGAMLSQIAM